MVPLRRVVTACCAALLLTSCGTGSSAAGDAETDRQSKTLADAISYPRQRDAAGLARAALATPLGRSPSFSVLKARDLDHKGPEDPMAHLIWRIHRDAAGAGRPAFDACYSVEFNYYGASSGPSRTTCPENAVAITPPPLPKRDIPENVKPALESILGNLPATPRETDVRAALASGLPAPPVDPETNLAGIPPEILVQVSGSDVGVALFAHAGGDDKDCMMGHRLGGAVKVWSLNHRDLAMLEKPCTAQAALAAR